MRRSYLRLIALVGLMVPRRLRAEWRQEWEAELRHRESILAQWGWHDRDNRQDLLRRSASAFWDALWLQRRRLEDEMFQDFRFAARMLLKQPGLTAIALLTLAFGIGANVALFSIVDALLLRSLPVKNPEQLVVFKRIEANHRTPHDLPYPTFERLRDQPESFSGITANWPIERFESADTPGAGVSGPAQIRVGMAADNYFSTLGVQAAIGRTFTPDDNRTPGAHPIAVISHNYWQRRFGLTTGIVGRTLKLAGTVYTIVGVTPAGFTGEWTGRPTDLWVPFMMASQVMPEVPGGPSRFPALLIGRLKPGVTASQAQAALQSRYRHLLREGAGAQLTAQQAQRLAERGIELEAGANGYAVQRALLAQPLQILTLVAGLGLLAVCASLANLLLARAESRERELAVRQALGARGSRIVRQLLTEGILLAGLGGTFGVLLAVWGSGFLTGMLAAGPLAAGVEDYSLSLDVHLNARVLACTAGLCLLVSILCSLAPALRSSKLSFTSALKERGAVTARGRRWFGLGRALVIAQVAISLVLIVGSGLLVRTLRNLQTQDVGFDRRSVLLVWAAPVRTGRTVTGLVDLAERVRERLSSLPGVVSASVSGGGVLDGSVNSGLSEALHFPGQPPRPGLGIQSMAISPGFFATVGTPLLRGREFLERDTDTSPKVAVVNETLARFFFGAEDPVGKRFRSGGEEGFPVEIVGLVKDAKLGTPRDQRGAWYFPYRQDGRFLRFNWSVAVHTSGPPAASAARIQAALRETEPNLPILRVNTIDGQLNYILTQERLIATLSGFFGVMAVLLSSLGLYGLISYRVARRTSEIGIRVALGATPGNVLRLVLQESVLLVLAGIAVGLPAAMALTRGLSSRLFHVSPTDPLTLGAGAALMLAVAASAAFFPARRARSVDPAVALRHD